MTQYVCDICNKPLKTRVFPAKIRIFYLSDVFGTTYNDVCFECVDKIKSCIQQIKQETGVTDAEFKEVKK